MSGQRNQSCLVLWGLVGLVCLAAQGCGDAEAKTYPVSGTVSLDGRPLEEGDIYFYPLDPNISADAGKIKAGQFEFRTKAGKKRVEIRASRVVPGKQTPMGGPVRAEFLPPRYNTQTTLMAEVLAKDENRFEFPLASDK
jgi:hypothetical protein